MYLNSLIKSIIFPSQKLSLRISQPQPIIKKDYDPFSEINPIVSNQEKLKENSKIVEQFAEELANKKYKKITFLTGAGISVSAGIPDFRSPETGLYAQIKKEYNISEPTKIFSIKYYKENPLPFIQVIKDFFSRDYEPTYAHKLINTLNKRKQLLVNITQNIDGLELKEGVQPQKVVQAHGHMRSAHCINCNHTVSIDTFIENCKHLKTTNCPKCQNLVKPKIVFFGEILPKEFYSVRDKLDKSDCVVVMGTSLGVFPFANLISGIQPQIPIIIINNQLPKNINHIENQIRFLQGDINEITQRIYDKIN